MRRREGAAGARGRLRVNGYIEHINPHVMSNICVPGRRSSGRHGEGVARHMQTQDFICQQLYGTCIMHFWVCICKQINWKWRDLEVLSPLLAHFFTMGSFIVLVCLFCFLSDAQCATAVLHVKEISDLYETNLDKRASATRAILWKGHLFPFEWTVMYGRLNHYPNYVSLHNQFVYRDEAYIVVSLTLCFRYKGEMQIRAHTWI